MSELAQLDTLWMALISFAGALVISVAGFGNSLVAMPVLISLFGLQHAGPLHGLIGFLSTGLIVLRTRSQIAFAPIWRLSIVSVVAIPFGILVLARAPQRIALTLLGLLMISYVIYRVSNMPIPKLESLNWAYLFGAVAGIFGGAFNTGGFFVAIYADAMEWQPDEFRGNINGYFLVSIVILNLTHWFSGNTTLFVLQHFLISIPFVIAGIFLGFFVNKRIDVKLFRKIVLSVIFLFGIRMSLSLFLL